MFYTGVFLAINYQQHKNTDIACVGYGLHIGQDVYFMAPCSVH